MSGLILPSFDLFMAMEGTSVSAIFSQMGEASLFKRLTTISKQSLQNPPEAPWSANDLKLCTGLKRDFERLLKDQPNADIQVLIDALNGDSSALLHLRHTGIWTLAARSKVMGSIGWVADAMNHCAEVEQACTDACVLYDKRSFDQFACEVSGNAVLRSYVGIQAAQHLNSQPVPGVAMLVRVVGLLNFLLSQAARMEHFFSSRHAISKVHLNDFAAQSFRPDGKLNPGWALFQCLKQLSGGKSMEAMLEHAAGMEIEKGGVLPSEPTLKRWSCGRLFPEVNKFASLTYALAKRSNNDIPDAAFCKTSMACFFVARRLDKTLRLMALLSSNPKVGAVLLDMLGSRSVEAWASNGYSQWLRHWRVAQDVPPMP
jgi:hypothetical protein